MAFVELLPLVSGVCGIAEALTAMTDRIPARNRSNGFLLTFQAASAVLPQEFALEMRE
jgi:hypothetical protein